MKALISPIEQQVGYRVAQVVKDEDTFPVANPYFWLDCGDEVKADDWYYDPDDQTFKEKPIPVVPEVATANNQPTTTGSQTL
jgi:hypothetical protein